jgi:hypothetical protein
MTGLVTIDNPSMEAAPATVGICQRDIDAVRKQMFIDFCSALEREGIPYAILAGHRDYPEKIASDVDFMVSEADFKRLPALLNSPSTVRGSQIVQILEHESSARYYVLVKQLGHRLAYLHPDAASNYRLDARLWMHSDAVLASRRKSPSGFWIPAILINCRDFLLRTMLAAKPYWLNYSPQMPPLSARLSIVTTLFGLKHKVVR